MQKRLLPLVATAIIIISLIGWGCTKLDTTDIGSDLLPAVDNVKTFDTLLFVNSTQGFFGDSEVVSKYEDFTIGSITNDPLFGRTTANVYMQLKPPFYPYYFGNPGDTVTGAGLGFDSIVLCMKYVGFWGDSSLPLNLEVREVSDFIFRDSVFNINKSNYRPFTAGSILGTASIDVRKMGDTIYYNNKRDKVTNQIRIKLPHAWGAAMFAMDSTRIGPNNAYFSDSLFRRAYNGLAVISTGGSNGLLYTALSDTATKLEIHYKKRNGGKIDSVYTSFRFNPVFNPNVDQLRSPYVSNSSNYIERNRGGFPISIPSSNDHYIQTAPGTYVNLNIPGLANFPNSIIHRAEIIAEQIPTDPGPMGFDEKFSAPNFLYVDLVDTGTTAKWKPVYFDLNTNEAYDPDFNILKKYIPSQIDFRYYGGNRRTKTDAVSGLQTKFYNINISRHIQQIVTDRTRAYDMRLFAPFNLHYPQYSPAYIPYGNNIAFGRVRIGGGSNPNYRLRLRIIYSKI